MFDTNAPCECAPEVPRRLMFALLNALKLLGVLRGETNMHTIDMTIMLLFEAQSGWRRLETAQTIHSAANALASAR